MKVDGEYKGEQNHFQIVSRKPGNLGSQGDTLLFEGSLHAPYPELMRISISHPRGPLVYSSEWKLPGIPANVPTPVPAAVFSDNGVTVAWDCGDDSGAHIELREVVIFGRSSILETRNSSTIPAPTNVAHFKSQQYKPRVETWQSIQNHH